MDDMSTPIFPLVDRILGGNLAKELSERRERGDSLIAIVHWLRDEHGITVSVETVRKWVAEHTGERVA